MKRMLKKKIILLSVVNQVAQSKTAEIVMSVMTLISRCLKLEILHQIQKVFKVVRYGFQVILLKMVQFSIKHLLGKMFRLAQKI